MIHLLDKMTSSQLLTLFIVLALIAGATIYLSVNAICEAITGRYEDSPDEVPPARHESLT